MKGHTRASVDAVADAVDKGAHSVVVQVALAGPVDGRLLAIGVGVQAQLPQRQHPQGVHVLGGQRCVARRDLQNSKVAGRQQAPDHLPHSFLAR